MATTAADQVSHTDSGLDPQTTCQYRVRAVNSGGTSPYSNVATATTSEATVIDDLANGELFVAGTVTGTFLHTQTSDQVFESIRERESGGKKHDRYSFLEHKWTVDVFGGGALVSVSIKAYKTVSSDGDDFVFAYSTDDSSYTDMLTVTNTSDDGQYQTFLLPSSLSGTAYVRVRDTDRTPGNRSRDTIFVDEIFIRSEPSGQGTDTLAQLRQLRKSR